MTILHVHVRIMFSHRDRYTLIPMQSYAKWTVRSIIMSKSNLGHYSLGEQSHYLGKDRQKQMYV